MPYFKLANSAVIYVASHVLLWFMVCGNNALAEQSSGSVPAMPDSKWLLSNAKEIPALINQGRLRVFEIPNPHWRDGTCNTCHSGDPGQAPVTFQDGDPVASCQYCHGVKFDHSYIHPVNILPDAAMIARMPAAYQKALAEMDNKITCLTCHDLYKQCLPKFRLQKGLNPAFFRSGPFRYRSDQCYFCHDAEQYKRFNPHEQKTTDGHINENTCRVCHSVDTKVLQSDMEGEKLQFYGIKDLASLCTRCHQVKPHPVVEFVVGPEKEVPNHLVKPSDKIHDHLLKRAKEDDIVLPLEPETGKVYCATCHNPHDKGILKKTAMEAGAGDKKKKRVRTKGRKICLYCHDV